MSNDNDRPDGIIDFPEARADSETLMLSVPDQEQVQPTLDDVITMMEIGIDAACEHAEFLHETAIEKVDDLELELSLIEDRLSDLRLSRSIGLCTGMFTVATVSLIVMMISLWISNGVLAQKLTILGELFSLPSR